VTDIKCCCFYINILEKKENKKNVKNCLTQVIVFDILVVLSREKSKKQMNKQKNKKNSKKLLT